LQGLERVGLQQVLDKGIGPFAKLHRRAAPGKPGQGNAVAAFEEPAGIVGSRHFAFHLVKDRDHRAFRNQAQDRLRRTAEQQGALEFGNGGDMGGAPLLQFGAQLLLFNHARLRPGRDG